jgi:hypothetical protein
MMWWLENIELIVELTKSVNRQTARKIIVKEFSAFHVHWSTDFALLSSIRRCLYTIFTPVTKLYHGCLSIPLRITCISSAFKSCTNEEWSSWFFCWCDYLLFHITSVGVGGGTVEASKFTFQLVQPCYRLCIGAHRWEGYWDAVH